MRYKLSKKYIVTNKILRRACMFSFSSLSLLLLFTISPLSFTPEYTEATSPDSDVVMSINFQSQTASASIDTVSNSGTFATSSDDEKISFTISTNNFTGYTLTLSSTSNGKLSNNNSNLDPIESSIPLATFSATNNTTYNNKWGYLPNIYNSAANTDYQVPPASGQDPVVLNTTSSANSPDGIGSPDTYSIGLGIRADYNSASGTYTNDTFVLQYVANPAIYTITYDENKNNPNDIVSNLPSIQEGTVGDNDITLGSEVPEREDDNGVTDYTFIGWCSVATTDTNNDGTDECSGTVYNPNGDGTNLSYSLSNISSLDSNEITLYAMWEPVVLSNAIYLTCNAGVTSVYIYNEYYGYSNEQDDNNACNAMSELRYGVAYTITAIIDEENYDFLSWKISPSSSPDGVTLGSVDDNPTTITLTDSHQEIEVKTTTNQKLTINAGNNIETVIVSDAEDNYKPYYATAEDPVILENQAANHKYLITVVPEANNILDSWDRSSSSGNLASDTLLTTTYTTGSSGETLTASGVEGIYNNTMQNLQDYGTVNATDERDGKSYTIKAFEESGKEYYYMLSNLRLDNLDSNNNPITLNSTTSNVSSSFTMPTLALDNTYYSAAAMQIYNHEYYYNWYAAKANPYVDADPTAIGTATIANDHESLGSICPAGWTLPNYNTDLTSSDLWDSGSNPGFLTATGGFASGQQTNFDTEGWWWSADNSPSSPDGDYSYAMELSSNNVIRTDSREKYYGMPIRCMADVTGRVSGYVDDDGNFELDVEEPEPEPYTPQSTKTCTMVKGNYTTGGYDSCGRIFLPEVP